MIRYIYATEGVGAFFRGIERSVGFHIWYSCDNPAELVRRLSIFDLV